MTEEAKEVERETPMDIGIGLGIAPPPVDAIDDLQSPPNSPGLVIAGIKTKTNEKIDFFALDSPATSSYSRDKGLSTQNDKSEANPMFATPSNLIKQRRLSASPGITKEDVDLNLFTSSDSYFSRARKNSDLSTLRRNKSKNRRASDVSDRSEGVDSFNSIGTSDMGSSGNYFSESDTELTASPSSKCVKRRNLKKKGYCNDATTDFSSIHKSHYNDGVVYRTVTNKSDASSGTSGLQSRSSSRPRSSRDKDDQKERNKEGSATAQIFKNMLILEESLRQQYMQQQKLRFKYTIILFLWSLLFIISTYVTSYNSIYALKEFHINSKQEKGFESSIAKCVFETTIENAVYCIDAPSFPTLKVNVENSQSKNRRLGHSNEILNLHTEESGYVLKNILYRVVSIINGMTLLLFFVTGEYTRTISRPRKFLITANKGIRQLNVKLVKVKIPWKDRFIGQIKQTNFLKRKQKVQDTAKTGVDHIKLVLNPRVFSTATREQWELYRNQFWNLEGIRRLGQEGSKTK